MLVQQPWVVMSIGLPRLGSQVLINELGLNSTRNEHIDLQVTGDLRCDRGGHSLSGRGKHIGFRTEHLIPPRTPTAGE